MPDFLHNHKEFESLLRIVGDELNILPYLVEKDYWIMHTLYGLKQNKFEFELKGGTSLSKAYNIIHRFSEDIDIHIKPPAEMKINENPKNTKAGAVTGRKNYYEYLAQNIAIEGIKAVERDTEFDDERSYRSGGIRLHYDSYFEPVDGIKEGILLEAGFARVTPNTQITISSWAYEKAKSSNVSVIDNRALDVACYHPGYTFVEKLQTIITKYRYEQNSGEELQNMMRQYYDVASLLNHAEVQDFIGSEEYETHKINHFGKADMEIPIAENQAFLLQDPSQRDQFSARYGKTSSLYYKGQPPFDDLIAVIGKWIDKL